VFVYLTDTGDGVRQWPLPWFGAPLFQKPQGTVCTSSGDCIQTQAVELKKAMTCQACSVTVHTTLFVEVSCITTTRYSYHHFPLSLRTPNDKSRNQKNMRRSQVCKIRGSSTLGSPRPPLLGSPTHTCSVRRSRPQHPLLRVCKTAARRMFSLLSGSLHLHNKQHTHTSGARHALVLSRRACQTGTDHCSGHVALAHVCHRAIQLAMRAHMSSSLHLPVAGTHL
jgi:hypothetical protein